MNIGKINKMKIERFTPNGCYLSSNVSKDDDVLLPKSCLTEDMEIGDEINVFLYTDTEDRVIATTKTPKIQVDQFAALKVKDITKIGAFLDWGLDKDLLLPFNEQTEDIKQNDTCVVYAKLDRKDRVMATMHISPYLRTDSDFKIDDSVNCLIYRIVKDIGAFVCVENEYSGLIPNKDIFQKLNIGDEVSCRITYIKEDGKIELSLREKAHIQRIEDSEVILEKLKENDGILYLHDKSSPKEIKHVLHMSKNSFKRAIGKLYKERTIDIRKDSIILK